MKPRRQRGDRDRAVAGGLVQAHGEAAPCGADEVDLHDHGRGPRESLVDAEQHVGDDDPAPRRRPHQQQRHRQADQPSRHEHRLAAHPIGKRPGEEVGDGFDRAEGDDEGERGGERGEPEDVVSRASGRTVRSWPIIPPTRALIATSSANCGRFARSPSRMGLPGAARCRSWPADERAPADRSPVSRDRR